MNRHKSLTGSTWQCIIENLPEFGMTCTVIDGEVDIDRFGESAIEIRYKNGAVSHPKLRHFLTRFKRIDGPVVKPTQSIHKEVKHL